MNTQAPNDEPRTPRHLRSEPEPHEVVESSAKETDRRWHLPSSPWVALANARRYGGAFARLYITRVAYDLHLMRPFLAAYRAMVASGNDVKW